MWQVSRTPGTSSCGAPWWKRATCSDCSTSSPASIVTRSRCARSPRWAVRGGSASSGGDDVTRGRRTSDRRRQRRDGSPRRHHRRRRWRVLAVRGAPRVQYRRCRLEDVGRTGMARATGQGSGRQHDGAGRGAGLHRLVPGQGGPVRRKTVRILGEGPRLRCGGFTGGWSPRTRRDHRRFHHRYWCPARRRVRRQRRRPVRRS